MHKTVTCKELTAQLVYAPKLKHSYIQIKHDSSIIIKTPYRQKKYAIEFFQDKESWIRKQLHKNSLRKPLHVNLEDEVLLFGEIYSIDSDEAHYLRKKLQCLQTSDKTKVLSAYDNFYTYTAKEYLPQRVDYFAQIMQQEYKTLKFRKMKSRWGSCSSAKIITFNTQLIKVHKELIDYVIVHELAHLVHMNHSKDFHDLVAKYLPHAKVLRKKLKNISLSL
ncbi:M48 family metallopeptidase [Sulfurimonas sp. NW7]|uniref:M48 family metallopeptidase n=1 Tax=Sulfurimonas sp. NW7 TaxID=2922727 RepID=UPI003DA7A7A9